MVCWCGECGAGVLVGFPTFVVPRWVLCYVLCDVVEAGHGGGGVVWGNGVADERECKPQAMWPEGLRVEAHGERALFDGGV